MTEAEQLVLVTVQRKVEGLASDIRTGFDGLRSDLGAARTDLKLLNQRLDVVGDSVQRIINAART